MGTQTNVPGNWIALLAVLLLAGFGAQTAQAGEDLTKEELIKSLQCRADQECQAPQSSRRRGFQPPQARRGFTFEPFTEEERKKLDEAAKAGKLPSADLEIYFDYDKAKITPAAQQALAPLGQALNDPKLAGNRFVLVGHTDAKGSEGYNQALSERRAAAVRDYLVHTFGITPERLVSYGRGKLVLKNSADPFAAVNRRVQVINHGVTAGVEHKR
jgi:outer membrane protein OmpA-like peptidoglycan-associated protein